MCVLLVCMRVALKDPKIDPIYTEAPASASVLMAQLACSLSSKLEAAGERERIARGLC